MPIELGFILQRWAAMAEEDASLREKQPWKAAHEKDYAWLGGAIDKHYAGDDSDVKVLLGGVLQAFAGQTVDEYAAAAAVVPRRMHLTRRSAGGCATAGTCRWSSSCATSRDTASRASSPRAAAATSCGRSRTRSTRSRPSASSAARTGCSTLDDEHGGSLGYVAEPDVFDDGPAKPVRIWSRIGRRPILAGGNSNGDIPMLRFAGGKGRPALRLLVLHDDAEREFDYTKGAEQALERAKAEDWTVVSVKNDWATVFSDV